MYCLKSRHFCSDFKFGFQTFRFHTFIYLIRFLSSVGSFMVCSLLVSHERFVAETASVAFVAAMCSFVLRQMQKENVNDKITNFPKSRGQLAQWKTVCFVKFHLIRTWFESCHMPSLLHARICIICMTPSLRNMLAELAISDSEQLLTKNF